MDHFVGELTLSIFLILERFIDKNLNAFPLRSALSAKLGNHKQLSNAILFNRERHRNATKKSEGKIKECVGVFVRILLFDDHAVLGGAE